MNKEIYLSNLKWTKTHDNMGGVIGNVIFKDNISYEECNKLFKSGYFILCDKNYITNLQDQLQQKENIIKEVREYIGSKERYEDDFDTEIEKVYKILDKGE